MDEIMTLPNIENRWQDEDIYEMLYQLTLIRNLKGSTS